MKQSILIFLFIALIGSCVIGAAFPPMGIIVIFLFIILSLKN